MNIPLVDLKKQFKLIHKDVFKSTKTVLTNTNFILGSEVDKFEKEFAQYLKVNYAVGVASGTDALLLSLRALGIGPGDEVITQANTFIATVLPIMYVGAKPILVDCDPSTYQIDPKLVEKAITKKTKLIIPVHLYGIPAPMNEIMQIAKKHKLLILEDACQAHGSSINGKMCGSFGDIAAFSFYPGKNLGATGDGGAVVTNSKKLADVVGMLRNVGQSEKYKHDLVGYNSRLDTLQAAILSIKLKHLNFWNQKRNQAANLYAKYLKGLPVVPSPTLNDGVVANYHLYVIRTKKRDKLKQFLDQRGVHCGIHYPIPVHLQKALEVLQYRRGSFPVTEKYAKEILSLPMYPELTGTQIKYICVLIREFFNKS